MNSIKIVLPVGIENYTYLNDEKEIACKYSTIMGNSIPVDLERIKEGIQKDGLVKILIDTSQYSENIIRGLLLGICSYLGEPTYTDQLEKKVLWNVAPKDNASIFTTFSEVDGEALLHTDSQFNPNPEQYFLLYCLVPAIKGGKTYLVEIKDILEQLKREKNGEEILKFLKETKVPFRVPSVFTKTGNDESIEIYKSTILSRNNKEIRFRVDTVEEALKIAPSLLTEEEKKIFKDFQEIIETRVKKINLALKSGEGLIIDNKRFLHGRTTFDDPNRLLYRIRFNDKFMKNKTVLITGATSGIGKSLVYKYIQEGYCVIATGRNTGKLKRLAKEVDKKELIYYKCDLILEDDIKILLEFLKDENIAIDILINNAGVGVFKSFAGISKQDIKTMMNTNLLGHIFLTQAILKQHDIKNICFISSLAGKIGFADLSIYSATKFAIEGFCDALREELMSSNIGVTIIRPGIVDTGFFDGTDFIDYANQIRPKMQTSNLIADKTYFAIKKGCREYTIGNDRYFLFLQKVLPNFMHRRVLKLFIN